MEIQKVKTQHVVSVRIRKRDWLNGTFWRMVDNAGERGGRVQSGIDTPWHVHDWSNRHTVRFVFSVKRNADRFHAWVNALHV